MAEHVFETAVRGYGTYRYAATPNNITFSEMLIAAGLASGVPDGCDGFDLYVVSSAAQLYMENDGTAADANTFPIDLGVSKFRRVRLSMTGDKFRFFSAGAQVIVIALWGSSSQG